MGAISIISGAVTGVHVRVCRIGRAVADCCAYSSHVFTLLLRLGLGSELGLGLGSGLVMIPFLRSFHACAPTSHAPL